ncbi:MAG: glycosyltransferase family 2 protein, partial [Pirellulaceae bacterium]
RFARVRLADRCRVPLREQLTMLCLPCKGDDGDLADNLQGFFAQQHPNYQLVFIVESRDDPAYAVIERERRRFPEVASEIVVAGVASEHGQKVHNLLAATENIAADVEVLAFADADILPDPDWLHTLTTAWKDTWKPLAVTGYRWLVPEKGSLINFILYSINSTTAGLLGRWSSRILIWGGSWSILRDNFDQWQLRKAWQRTLSDDLVATRHIDKCGDKIVYDPRCLSISRFNMNWAGALEFMRRQYLIARKYTPRVFWPGYLVLLVCVSGWWGLVALAAVNAGNSFGWLYVAGAGAIYLANVIKGVLRQSVFRARNKQIFQQNRAAAAFDIFCWPIVASLMLLIVTISIPGNRICWRGNQYLIKRGGEIELLNPASAANQELSPQNKAA